MNRRILLHIGSPKCGSTFLQRALLDSRKALAAVGVNYPAPGGTHPGNAGEMAEMDAAAFEALFEGRMRTAILSHEDLFAQARRGESLQAFAEATGTEVQVLAFLRPFSEFVFGDYSQFMKQHFERFLKARDPYDGRGFEQFAVDRANRLSPLVYFRKWQARFPDTPLMIRSHRTIRETLTPWLNGADVSWEVPRDQTNPSLRMIDCDRLARAMRDASVPPAQVRDQFRAAFHRTGDPDPGRSAERTAWIEAIFSTQNEGLMTEFGYDNRRQR